MQLSKSPLINAGIVNTAFRPATPTTVKQLTHSIRLFPGCRAQIGRSATPYSWCSDLQLSLITKSMLRESQREQFGNEQISFAKGLTRGNRTCVVTATAHVLSM
jgi:hypothetical protein